MPRPSLCSLLLLSVALACGTEGGGTTDSGGATDGATGTTSTPTSGATTSPVTTGGSTDTGGSTSGSSGDTSGTSSTSDTSGTSGDTTGVGSTTGVDVAGFERFTMTMAAGPCPPDLDCDGFIEVLGSGLLRVEPFGELGDPVTEAMLAPEDLAAALPVFADPSLRAVLDGPEPLCNPPTDIFESMTVVVDGVSHDATTTFCDQPPLVAARMMATTLRDKYVP